MEGKKKTRGQGSGNRDQMLGALQGLYPLHPHGGSKNLRNGDGPVLLLIVFEDGNERSAYGQAGAVQRVNLSLIHI